MKPRAREKRYRYTPRHQRLWYKIKRFIRRLSRPVDDETLKCLKSQNKQRPQVSLPGVVSRPKKRIF